MLFLHYLGLPVSLAWFKKTGRLLVFATQDEIAKELNAPRQNVNRDMQMMLGLRPCFIRIPTDVRLGTNYSYTYELLPPKKPGKPRTKVVRTTVVPY